MTTLAPPEPRRDLGPRLAFTGPPAAVEAVTHLLRAEVVGLDDAPEAVVAVLPDALHDVSALTALRAGTPVLAVLPATADAAAVVAAFDAGAAACARTTSTGELAAHLGALLRRTRGEWSGR